VDVSLAEKQLKERFRTQKGTSRSKTRLSDPPNIQVIGNGCGIRLIENQTQRAALSSLIHAMRISIQTIQSGAAVLSSGNPSKNPKHR
jgi:hypothetical protein